jgi:hypothetical protein
MSGDTINTGFNKIGQYWCWRPEHGDKDSGQRIEAISERDAAERYMANNFDRWDYPSSLVVNVERCSMSIVYTFDVESVPEPSFYATERKPKR